MRVILHGMTHDICHLIIPTVIKFFKRMHDTPLDGFKAIFYGRYGSFQYDIGSIIQEPVFVHTRYPGQAVTALFLFVPVFFVQSTIIFHKERILFFCITADLLQLRQVLLSSY